MEEAMGGIPSGVHLSVNPSGARKNGQNFQKNPSEKRQGTGSEASAKVSGGRRNGRGRGAGCLSAARQLLYQEEMGGSSWHFLPEGATRNGKKELSMKAQDNGSGGPGTGEGVEQAAKGGKEEETGAVYKKAERRIPGHNPIPAAITAVSKVRTDTCSSGPTGSRRSGP